MSEQNETNLVACKIAHELFGIRTRIARLRNPELTDGSQVKLIETSP